MGLAKTAKTILAIKMGKAMAKEEPLFSYPAHMCRVLYMVLERHIDFRHKIARMMTKSVLNNFRIVECKKPLILDAILNVDSRSGNALSILKQEIQDFKADVVILDSRYKTTSREEKDEEATKYWISNIEYLIENTGCACIAIHHSPKNEYTELVNRAAGSSILARWADVVIGVRRVNPKNKKDPRRIIEFVSNAGDEPDDITVKITDTDVEEVTEPVDMGKLAQAMEILEKNIKDNPEVRIGRRITDLSEKHDIGARTFWNAWYLVKSSKS